MHPDFRALFLRWQPQNAVFRARLPAAQKPVEHFPRGKASLRQRKLPLREGLLRAIGAHQHALLPQHPLEKQAVGIPE